MELNEPNQKHALVRKHINWTPDDVQSALEAYVLHGSIQEASRTTSVPPPTICLWIGDPRNQQLLDSLARETARNASYRAGALFAQHLEQIQDRLTNGDEVVSPKGEVVRRLMSGRDLAFSAAMLASEARAWAAVAASTSAPTDVSHERLQELEETYARARAELERRRQTEQDQPGELAQALDSQGQDTPVAHLATTHPCDGNSPDSGSDQPRERGANKARQGKAKPKVKAK